MDDLKLIKKYYGEKMMHLCRNLFPSLLRKEGLLFSLLEKEFAHSKLLAEDIIKYSLQERFRSYIYCFIEEEKIERVETTKTPKELMSDAGYDLYECKTNKEIHSFKKYYKQGEELCTFKEDRLKDCHVFFAVKKDVDKIKRENNPTNDDPYGISVISIQFSRGKNNILSIKNRYNHTVKNPDSTFENNLENIISGLTYSFEKEYSLNIQQEKQKYNFENHNYVKANDGKYYKYNYQIGDVYYCPNNIIIDNFEVKKYEKEKYIIMDYFILDLVNKKISLYDNSFLESFIDELTNIDKIEVINTNDGKIIKIIYDKDKEAIIKLDKFNRMICYENNSLKELKDSFLRRNKYMQEVSLPNVEKIGNYVLSSNVAIEELCIPNAKFIGNYFLTGNKAIKQLNIPNVREIGDFFLGENCIIEEISLPNVEKIGDQFLYDNNSLKQLNIPNVEIIGDKFLCENDKIEEINIPKVKNIGEDFLFGNRQLKKINLSNNVIVEIGFLNNNKKLLKLKLLLMLKSRIIRSNLNKGRSR